MSLKMKDGKGDVSSGEKLVKSVSNGKISKTESTWYNNLPTNVLVSIFKHFTEREIQQNIMQVCQNWRYASMNPVLWKRLTIYGNLAPIDFIMTRLRQLKHLEAVFMQNVSNPITIIKQICRCNPYLMHLSLRHCPPIPENILLYLIRTCKNLQTLDFSGTTCMGEHFFEEICTLPYLKSVNFSDNPYLSVQHLISIAMNCNNLEEFRLSNFMSKKYNLKDEDVLLIMSYISHNLTVLSLDVSTLSNLSFDAIMNCSSLKKLALYGAHNMSRHFFKKIWICFPNLVILKVRNAFQIIGADVEKLCGKGESVLKNLTHLDLTGCIKISDDGIDAIVNCCRNLEVLHLKACKTLKDASKLRGNELPKLRTLNVAFCLSMDLNTLLPLKQSLRKVIIDEEQKFIIASTIYAGSELVTIYIDYCEYSKNLKKL